MNYNSNVIGHYSKARRLARIYLRAFESGNYCLYIVYEKNVSYQTYNKNLKRIIKENEIA